MFERYAQSKHDIAKDLNLSIQGFRYFNVYGHNEEHKGSQASPYTQFSKQASENGVIKVFENSQAYMRDFIHVNKVIEIHKTFLSIKSQGVYNVGTGSNMTYQNLLESRKEFVSYSLQPFICSIEDRLSMDDITPRGHVVKFAIEESFLRADTMKRLEAIEKMLNLGLMQQFGLLGLKPPLN